MNFFYDYKLRKFKKVDTKDKYGKPLTGYVESNIDFLADVQPSSERILQETFGKQIEAQFVVYSDEELQVNDRVRNLDFDNKVYEIIDRKVWKGAFNYFIYAIKEVN